MDNHNKDLPDPSIDWDFIQYNTRSDGIRPSPGWRICTKCGNCYPVNNYYFGKKKSNPDGYTYQCKTCIKNYRERRKQNEKAIKTTKENNV